MRIKSKKRCETKPGGKSFGQVLAEARKQSNLTQSEVIRQLAHDNGVLWDETYLSALEHNRRYRPSNHLIEQLARIVKIPADVLYFHANRIPPDITRAVENAQVVAAYRAFRNVLRRSRRVRQNNSNIVSAKLRSKPGTS